MTTPANFTDSTNFTDSKCKDLRAEQVELLRFEKAIETACRNVVSGKPLDKAPVFASLAALAASAGAVSAKLGTDAPLRLVVEAKVAAAQPVESSAWLLNLAEAASKSHALLESLAREGAFQIFQAGGGTPKRQTTETVSSLLMNGPF